MTKRELIGNTLKKQYFIREFIDAGGMADVYLAWDQVRTARMAVKVLRRDLAINPRFYQMFNSEADKLHDLEHPNIVRLYEFGREGDIVYIVMEWVEGGNVRDLIKKQKGPLSLDQASRILKEVSSALHYAHQKNIFHCDIKPANIMLRSDKRVLLTDFGVARRAAETTWGGTPVYMAPEQFPELPYSGTVDARTDVYALGVTLYEMLSGGGVPFRGDSHTIPGQKTRERIAWEIQYRPIPPLSRYNQGLSNPVANVVQTALNKDPARRYNTVMELSRAFEQARTGKQTFRGTRRTVVPSVPPRVEPTPAPSHLHASAPSPPPISPPSPIPSQTPQPKGPHLYGRAGEWVGRTVEITRSGVTIGRSHKNILHLREPSVSRNHATITRSFFGRGLFIRDENSTLGVFVNGQRIPVQNTVRLKHGDTIQLGFYQVFELRES